MIIIRGTIKLESEAEFDRVKAALEQRAARSRQDAGNLAYTFSQNVEDPSEVILTECWEDDATLQAHLAIPDEAFNELLTTAKIERAVVVAHESSSDRVLMER